MKTGKVRIDPVTRVIVGGIELAIDGDVALQLQRADDGSPVELVAWHLTGAVELCRQFHVPRGAEDVEVITTDGHHLGGRAVVKVDSHVGERVLNLTGQGDLNGADYALLWSW